MARWVDTRIPAGSASDAIGALITRFAPLIFRLDLSPPASGPEIELSVQDVPEADVQHALVDGGIPVLAIRTRLDEAAAAAPARLEQLGTERGA